MATVQTHSKAAPLLQPAPVGKVHTTMEQCALYSAAIVCLCDMQMCFLTC